MFKIGVTCSSILCAPLRPGWRPKQSNERLVARWFPVTRRTDCTNARGVTRYITPRNAGQYPPLHGSGTVPDTLDPVGVGWTSNFSRSLVDMSSLQYLQVDRSITSPLIVSGVRWWPQMMRVRIYFGFGTENGASLK
ncbi:hypothetical protein EVAR_70002_1 [Eumeta japonica]|uniref:Uncharacterized protein n=1 Tax=Eumeta variegata TaxID=151549 RepID=A0A4C2A4D6_EUMVA|nr:hypothetical protein EVAR_70002_1 [Eumeta japonica]